MENVLKMKKCWTEHARSLHFQNNIQKKKNMQYVVQDDDIRWLITRSIRSNMVMDSWLIAVLHAWSINGLSGRFVYVFLLFIFLIVYTYIGWLFIAFLTKHTIDGMSIEIIYRFSAHCTRIACRFFIYLLHNSK